MSETLSDSLTPDSLRSEPISASNSAAGAGVGAGDIALAPAPTATSSNSAAKSLVVRDLFRGWPRILAWTVGGVIVAATGTTYGVYEHWKGNGRIAPGVRVQGVDLGGLTRDQARTRLRERFGAMTLRLRTPDGLHHLPLSALGGAPQIERMVEYSYNYGRSEAAGLLKNVQRAFVSQDDSRFLLPVRWDKAQMRRAMYALNAKYEKPGQDARLEFSNGTLNVVPEQLGTEINAGATLRDLQKKYYPGLQVLGVTTRETHPKITSDDLAGRDVEIGRYRTRFNSGLWGRTRNIHIASNTIDGRVLMPGETFSFNETTGERTWDKGYRMAHIFERKPGQDKAEVVEGLAGGICQVSSTLYNAVRKANLQTDGGIGIVQRHSHSLPVDYVPSGMDATVAWPNLDFKFRNNYEFPIYLRSVVDGNRLIVTVRGRVPDSSSTRFATVTSEN